MERIPQARLKPAPTLNEKNRRGGKNVACFPRLLRVASSECPDSVSVQFVSKI